MVQYLLPGLAQTGPTLGYEESQDMVVYKWTHRHWDGIWPTQSASPSNVTSL